MKILHFADAHIDMANYGRHDPQSGLPLRVLDFLKSLDAIVDAAIAEKVDLVLFAGDTYKDRNPAPTFQREWGRRIMRLSRAEIPTLLLVGNHDLSPAFGRAHALESFDTLEVPYIRVIDRPCLLRPEDLGGLSVQVIAIPWLFRSGVVAQLGMNSGEVDEVHEQMEVRLVELVEDWLQAIVQEIPVIMLAHASVQGAKFGAERSVMLGNDLVLPGSLVNDPRLDYVALGHIHRAQNLNEDSHPPVIYPGSIERVDFGEAGDQKYFVIAEIERGHTRVDWRPLTGIRPMLDYSVKITSNEKVYEQIIGSLPNPEKLQGAILRLVLEYPRDWEAMIDEAALRDYTRDTFELHLVRRPLSDERIRLPGDQAIGSLTPIELLEIYWKANHVDSNEMAELKRLALEIVKSSSPSSIIE
jgi:exonuclease SbcD